MRVRLRPSAVWLSMSRERMFQVLRLSVLTVEDRREDDRSIAIIIDPAPRAL
jgi:hypothetical protein